MPERTWDEANAERMQLQEQLAELQQHQTPLEQLTELNSAVDELRAMLQSTAEGTEGANEQLSDYLDQLGSLGGRVREALEDADVSEFTEGVGEGLDEVQEALEGVDGAFAPLDEALDLLQEALELADAPPTEQLEALAELLEGLIDKLGPLIDRIPILREFLELYTLAIRRISISVGSIQKTQRGLQSVWGELRAGTTMYLVPRNAHERREAEIRETEYRIEVVTDEMLDMAIDQRNQIPEDSTHEVDILIVAAESRSSDLQPDPNAPELRARNDAWHALQHAEQSRAQADDELDRTSQEADEASIRLQTQTAAGGSVADMDALTARSAMANDARDRAAQHLGQREAEYDAAMGTYQGAKAPWDALNQRYTDSVKGNINSLGPYTNNGQGLSDGDRSYLDLMYPEYSASETIPDTDPADPEPQASVPQATGTAGGIAGLSRRAVMIGGGGIFALAMVGLVLFFPGGGDDGIASDSKGSSSTSGSSSSSGGSSSTSGSSSSSGGSSSTSGSSSSSGGSSSGGSSSGGSSSGGSSSSGSSSSSGGAAVATAEPTACELLRRKEPLVLEVSSPDIVGGAIPEHYLLRNAYDNDFPTPRFEWSAVPPEATEIVILTMIFEDDEFAELQNDPNPRGETIRHGSERWVLSGLDPSLTSLANTSLTVSPPAGAVEQANQGPVVRPNGVGSQSKFGGPGFPENHFMFAVVALCEGGGTDRGTYRGFALGEDAIAMGWFFAEPPWE